MNGTQAFVPITVQIVNAVPLNIQQTVAAAPIPDSDSSNRQIQTKDSQKPVCDKPNTEKTTTKGVAEIFDHVELS